jgi:hypothetical protein
MANDRSHRNQKKLAQLELKVISAREVFEIEELFSGKLGYKNKLGGVTK